MTPSFVSERSEQRQKVRNYMQSVTVTALSLLYKSGVSGRSWIPRTVATLPLLTISFNLARF